jgi:diguanylate cyclase (GGDEF)-like protein
LDGGGRNVEINRSGIGSGRADRGEEFVILLPDIKERDAKRLADRLCKSVRKMKLDAITGSITISIGVSRYDPTSVISYANSDILEQADTALYTAKRNGRDQVSYYSQF